MRLVVGMGNRLRRDDGVGPAVLDALAGVEAQLHELGDDATRLVELFEGIDAAVIVDAMRAGVAPGSLKRFEGDALPRQGFPRASTHTLPLPDALGLAAALGHTPRVVVVGVEAADLSRGEGLSDAVAEAVPRAAALVREILEEVSRA